MNRSHVRHRNWTAFARRATVGVLVLVGAACSDSPLTNSIGEIVCDIDDNLLSANLPPNAIPAISGPTMVGPDHISVDYMVDSDRVMARIAPFEVT